MHSTISSIASLCSCSVGEWRVDCLLLSSLRKECSEWARSLTRCVWIEHVSPIPTSSSKMIHPRPVSFGVTFERACAQSDTEFDQSAGLTGRSVACSRTFTEWALQKNALHTMGSTELHENGGVTRCELLVWPLRAVLCPVSPVSRCLVGCSTKVHYVST